MKTDTSQDMNFYIIGGSCILAAIIYVVLKFVFGIDVIESMGVCTFYLVTGGYYCPGCGATRAVYALARGDFLASLYYNPFICYIAVVGGWFMISQTIERLSHGKLPIAMHFRMIYVWIGLALMFGNCILKNAVLLFTGVSLM